MAIETTSDLSLVGTSQIVDGSVTSAKIAAGAVGSAALASGAVVAASIAAGAVGSAAIASGAAANGAVLTANGSGAASFLAAAASGGILKYQEFTSSGSFVIPTSASSSSILILNVVGAGAGGASGQAASSGASVGGAGGVGGGIGDFIFLSSAIGTPGGTVTVTIGAGGAGGASVAPANSGLTGSAGGTTSFGTLNFKGGGAQPSYNTTRSNYRFDSEFVMIARDTGTNHAGTASGSTKPDGLVKATINDLIYSAKFSHGARSASDNFYSAWDTVGIAAGGGGGGGCSASVAKRGGNGGKFFNSASEITTTDDTYGPNMTFGNGASGGTAAGNNGTSVSAGLLDGAGGGAGATAGPAGSGGNAAIGGGGGGGGAGVGQNSGAGGAGGSGRIRVWVIG